MRSILKKYQDINWKLVLKKKIMIVVALLIVVACGFSLVYAQDTSATSASAALTNAGMTIAPELDFTGAQVNLSLAQAIDQAMASGSGIETAKINKASNLAKSESYYETEDIADTPQNITGMTADMANYAADFAAGQAQRNYDAEVNALRKNVVKKYFEALQAKDAVRIGKENIATQEKILKNTNEKFKLGVVAKQDVLKAEVALNQAKVDVLTLQNCYTQALMSLNQFFGYPILQNTILTDTLQVEEPTVTPLADAVQKAFGNRNEMIGANFQKQLQKMNLIAVGDKYDDDSAKYLAAEAALMSAKKASNDAPKAVEIDVRTKYMQLQAASSAVTLGKLNVEKSKESLRLANLSYDAGLITVVDVQQAQQGKYQAELQLSKNILTYKLTIIDYEQSMTVGTYSVPF